MAQDKFGGMELGLINTDDLKVKSFKDLKLLLEQAEKLEWKGPEEDMGYPPRQIVIVPKSEYDFFGKEAVNALEDKFKVLVVPVDYTDPFERTMAELPTAHLAMAVNVPTSRLFELPDSAQSRIEIDTTDMPNPRYHDRTFPKHYDKKKRAKRRQQKHSRRRH